MSENIFGTRLKKIRESRGLTQQELANKLGISKRMMNYYENRVISPPVSLFPKLCKTLKTSADELLGTKNLPKDELLSTDKRLLRRFKAVAGLTERERRSVFTFIRALQGKHSPSKNNSHEQK